MSTVMHELAKFEVTIRRFDPHQGASSGEVLVLPVDCLDAEHIVAATLSNAIAWTPKTDGSGSRPVGFCCVERATPGVSGQTQPSYGATATAAVRHAVYAAGTGLVYGRLRRY